MELLRGNRAVLRRKDVATEPLRTTWMTASELYFGAACSRRREANAQRVDELLIALPPLPSRLAAWRHFGRLKADLRRRGEGIADADLLIAAVCLQEGATLATGNLRHYSRVVGLRFEDWLA